QALVLRRAEGDQARVAATLGNLGLAALHGGQFDRARAFLEESIGVLSGLDDSEELQVLRARRWHNLGLAARLQGDRAAAWWRETEALAVFQRCGDHESSALALSEMAYLSMDDGDHQVALARLREGLALRRRMDHSIGLAWSVHGFAALAAARGDSV